jgi:hypothetical protein
MLDSVGVKWALAGHSERREIFGETDEYINGQCLKLIDQGMSVMLCVGESESEYEQNLAGSVCAVQLKKGLAGISKEQMRYVFWTSYNSISNIDRLLLIQNRLLNKSFFSCSQQPCCYCLRTSMGNWYWKGCNPRDCSSSS